MFWRDFRGKDLHNLNNYPAGSPKLRLTVKLAKAIQWKYLFLLKHLKLYWSKSRFEYLIFMFSIIIIYTLHLFDFLSTKKFELWGRQISKYQKLKIYVDWEECFVYNLLIAVLIVKKLLVSFICQLDCAHSLLLRNVLVKFFFKIPNSLNEKLWWFWSANSLFGAPCTMFLYL